MTTSGQSAYPFVSIEVDGTARELHADERAYLETVFKLPAGTSVKPAPLDDPNRPLSRDEYISFRRAKGLEVTERAAE